MRIFDSTKTYELSVEQIDYNLGYLKQDRKFVQHHNAVQYIEAVYIDRVEKLPNGSTQVWKDLITPAVEAKEDYDEYEDIQVYILYTEEERKNILRTKRKILLNAFDKWEKAVLRGRESDDDVIMDWYHNLLDLEESAFDNVPEKVKYFV